MRRAVSDHEQAISELSASAWYDYECEGHRRIVYISDGVEDEITSKLPMNLDSVWVESDHRLSMSVELFERDLHRIRFKSVPPSGERITIDYKPQTA